MFLRFFMNDPTPRAVQSVDHQALEAQRALLPYALVAFGVGLPMFVWAGSHGGDPLGMTMALVAFAVAWAGFYGVVNWLREPQAENLALRARVQLIGGLLWSAAIVQMSAFAYGAAPAQTGLLLLSVGAAVVCIFFTATWLPSLVLVGGVAAAGPLASISMSPMSADMKGFAWGAVALAFALALMLNRALRRQFALAAERELLIAERAGMLEDARRLAQSKSDLVATLSHEIRNGLAGVVHVLAAAADRSGRQAPSREQLSAALAAANDLILVLDTTLDAETAETGRLHVDRRPVDALAVVQDLVLQHRPAAAAKGLELGLHVEAELAEAGSGAALADPLRVRQILVSLIGNAVKFTVRGRLEVRIERAGSDRIAIEIADTGPGLTAEELAQAFAPFHRVERTSVGVPGAGLGLSLSLQLARLMGGDLIAHSAVGVGSCFRLELPYDPSAAREAPVAEQAPPPRNEAVNPGPLRVLVAEDEGLQAAMLRASLEQLGHQMVHAIDGRRAVDLSRICDFDLMMIDARMPNVDGAEAIRTIRAGAKAETPVIAMVEGDADAAADCVAAGADVVLRKPISVSALARAVADAVAARADEAGRKVA